MNKVKYFSTYSGPSYGSLYADRVDAHSSLYGAMKSMRNRQDGSDSVVSYVETEDDLYILEENEQYQGYMFFPATTPEDIMWVYWAIPDFEHYSVVKEDGTVIDKKRRTGGYIMGDLAYCITVGIRGGVKAEKA